MLRLFFSPGYPLLLETCEYAGGGSSWGCSLDNSFSTGCGFRFGD